MGRLPKYSSLPVVRTPFAGNHIEAILDMVIGNQNTIKKILHSND